MERLPRMSDAQLERLRAHNRRRVAEVRGETATSSEFPVAAQPAPAETIEIEEPELL